MISPLVAFTPKVFAADAICPTGYTGVADVQGADDQPGQKDLNQFCEKTDVAAGTIAIAWSWDDTVWNGNNSGDSCALFDNNGNGMVDYAVCVTVRGNPAKQVVGSPFIYKCADNDPDNCSSATISTESPQTVCTVSQEYTDPFHAGQQDTVANCIIALADVGQTETVIADLKDVCSYPSLSRPSDPSDCVIIRVNKSNPVIELVKDVAPNTDQGLFDLDIYAISGNSSSSIGSTNAVGDGGSTGEVEFMPNVSQIRIQESSGSTSTSLSNYVTTASCVNNNSTSPFFTSPSLTGSQTRSSTFTVPNNVQKITCTFTNTRKGSITVNKVTSPMTSATPFSFTTTGTGLSNFELDTSADTALPSSQVFSDLNNGTHTITEDTSTNWQFANLVCTGGDVTISGSTATINLVAGQAVNCTYSNNRKVSAVKVNKQVINDNGGRLVASDFTVTDGTSTHPFVVTDSPNGSYTFTGLYAGESYSFTEPEANSRGYTTDQSNCANVTVVADEVVECTIVNNDQAPALKVKKTVINDNGGYLNANDFGINLGANYTGSLFFSGAEVSPTNPDAVTYTANANSVLANTAYTPNEAGAFGYRQVGNWACTDDQTGLAVAVPVVLAPGQKVTCAVTNDDIAPKLYLNKVVINNNGGTRLASSWELSASGQTSFSGPGVDNSSTDVASPANFKAGSYTLVESGDMIGYEASGWVCTGTANTGQTISIEVGQAVTCTITNDDIPPFLQLNKIVVNEYGSPASNLLWTLNADGSGNTVDTSLSGTSGVTSGSNFYTGSYTLSETGGVAGYTPSAWVCNNRTLGTDNLLIMLLGQNVTCTITNTAVAPKLTIKKVVDLNGTNRTETASDFTLDVNANSPSKTSVVGSENGETITLNEGAYAVSERANSNFSVDYSAGCTGEIKVGDEKECVVTNTAIKNPGLEVEKSGPDYAYEGDTVTYQFRVKNTGNVLFPDGFVVDTVEGEAPFVVENYVSGDANNDNVLDPGEEWLFERTYVIPAGQISNVKNEVEVCAYDEDEEITCDTDDHELDVLHPSVSVSKSGPANAQPGEKLTYDFAVKNTGDVALDVKSVVDDVAGLGVYVSGDVNNNNLIDVDETWNYQATVTAPSQTGTVKNTVTVCAVDDKLGDQEVCANDDHSTIIYKPQVLADTSVLADTGNGILYTTFLALLSIATGLLVVFGRRRSETSTAWLTL